MEAIRTINLTKRYGDVLAVDHINFEVRRGGLFGLLGPNGAGKTTTIRILSGLTKPSEGKAFVLGFDIAREAIKVKERIGVVPEISNLYGDMTAWDNLIFSAELYGVPRTERTTRAKELLELFGLYDRRNEHVARFSKGMKRRLTIAAALIHEPEILFLDEPTTGLDVQSARLIRNLVQELNRKGVTVFLTTHYIEEADQLCKEVAILNRGIIVIIDSPEGLKASIQEAHVIELSFNRSFRRLEEELKGLDFVERVTRLGDKFKLYTKDSSSVLPLITDYARTRDLRIVSINTLQPSLEDAFIKITGLSVEIMLREKEQTEGGTRG